MYGGAEIIGPPEVCKVNVKGAVPPDGLDDIVPLHDPLHVIDAVETFGTIDGGWIIVAVLVVTHPLAAETVKL